MLNQRWRKLFAKTPHPRNTEVRLSVESLEPRSLLAGLPMTLMFEMSSVADGMARFGEAGPRIGSPNAIVSMRGWTVQELAPRSTTVIVIIENPAAHAPPVAPPVNDRLDPGPGSGRPIGEPGGGRPGFGGFGGPRNPEPGEGEPPDVAPVRNPPASVPGELPSLPRTPAAGTGLDSPTSPLGSGSTVTGSTSSSLPVVGSNASDTTGLAPSKGNGSGLGLGGTNSRDLSPPTAPGGIERTAGADGGSALVSSGAPSSNLATSNRDLIPFGIGGGLTQSSNSRAQSFSMTEVDEVWGNWSAWHSDSSWNNPASAVVSERLANVVSPLKSAPKKDSDSTEESLDKSGEEDTELDENSTGLLSRKSDRQDVRWNRLSRGSRMRSVSDRDWLASARPSEDAVDAILAELQRIPTDSNTVDADTADAADADEGGLIEVIIEAAADRPVTD